MDETKLEQFMGQCVADLGAAINGLMVYLGDQLGLYKAMAGAGPLEPAELAARSGTDERHVREWLDSQAAGGYVTYDAGTRRYELPEEQALRRCRIAMALVEVPQGVVESRQGQIDLGRSVPVCCGNFLIVAADRVEQRL